MRKQIIGTAALVAAAWLGKQPIKELFVERVVHVHYPAEYWTLLAHYGPASLVGAIGSYLLLGATKGQKSTPSDTPPSSNDTFELLLPTLKDLFESDFSGLRKLTRYVNSTSDGPSDVDIVMQLHQDAPSNASFISFYIPKSRYTFKICRNIAWTYKSEYEQLIDSMVVSVKLAVCDATLRALAKMEFSGRIYIYHETDLSVRQIADLTDIFLARGLSVQFRGHDYAQHEWTQRQLTA